MVEKRANLYLAAAVFGALTLAACGKGSEQRGAMAPQPTPSAPSVDLMNRVSVGMPECIVKDTDTHLKRLASGDVPPVYRLTAEDPLEMEKIQAERTARHSVMSRSAQRILDGYPSRNDRTEGLKILLAMNAGASDSQITEEEFKKLRLGGPYNLTVERSLNTMCDLGGYVSMLLPTPANPKWQ